MKRKRDVVQGWVRKAMGDLSALEAALGAKVHDAACFHAQQAAEKFLKAYLTASGADFPLTHNLARLVLLCAEKDEGFRELIELVATLTPYAVEVRYDIEFEPSAKEAREAQRRAQQVSEFVLDRLSKRKRRGAS